MIEVFKPTDGSEATVAFIGEPEMEMLRVLQETRGARDYPYGNVLSHALCLVVAAEAAQYEADAVGVEDVDNESSWRRRAARLRAVLPPLYR